jgi:anti-anti-sigma regulatory factor
MAHRIDASLGGAEPLKMERQYDGKTTVIWLIGRIRAEHLPELERQIRDSSETRVLDLSEVTIVDAEVIRFLSASEREGTRLRGCPAYVREWILRERTE